MLDDRIALRERSLRSAYRRRPHGRSSGVVALGSRVLLEDLDDGTREEYVLVVPAESNPSAGRLSSESPVGRSIVGRRYGNVVDAHAPHGIRHLRIRHAVTRA
jgi:transcription elongation factor GreA